VKREEKENKSKAIWLRISERRSLCFVSRAVH